MPRQCDVKDCARPHRSRGLCTMHYDRWRRLGTTDLPAPPAIPPTPDGRTIAELNVRPGYMEVVERILPHLELGPEGCWIWTGAVDRYGYGRGTGRRDKHKVSILIHRALWTALVADPDPEFHLDHMCRRRACCNPGHLEHVTHKVNVRRGLGPIAERARQRRCIHGHDYTPENTGYSGRGTRYCKACNAIRQAATKQRKRERLAAEREGALDG